MNISVILGGGSAVTFKHKDGVNKPHFSINKKSEMSNIKQNGAIYHLKKHYGCNTSNWNILGSFIVCLIQSQSWLCLSGGGQF